jgi:NADPH-dependent 2,4-dienoyl-CoA reductase/sulfur reductase-like enzyme
MESTKYLLVGGGIAANEALKQIRKLDPAGTVTLVSDEPVLPYDRPPLSKEFLRGDKPREKLFYAPEGFYRESGVTALLGRKAQSLDPSRAMVTLSDDTVIRYEKLLIATGGRPVPLNVPGANSKGVHYLRSLADAEAIATEAKPGRRAVLVGAGFIGMELAASLTKLGVQVTVVEMLPHIWPRFAGEGLAQYVLRYCQERGVTFITSDSLTEIKGQGHVTSVRTKLGRELPCDMVCAGIGLIPNLELARSGGLKIENGVVVDQFMHTSHPNIFAAGDIAAFPDPVFGRQRRVEHWGHAEYSGQVAGMNMAGKEMKYDLLSYVWSDIFDLHLEFAGDEHEHDQTLLRGEMATGKFTVLYLKGGALTAYFSINTDAKEFPVYQRLIRRRKDLSASLDKLKDATFNVRGLL